MKLLTTIEIENKLQTLSGWVNANNSIEKEFIKKNFLDALAFLNSIAQKAEELDHHPDVLLHSYNKLKIIISTHSAGGITENDFKLASIIEEIADE